MNRMLLWQWALCSQMIGLETCVTVLVLMVVVNIQTLGAPVAFTSIPGILSSIVSVAMIPALGFAADRWGTTRLRKAKIVGWTSAFLLLGVLLVLIANTIDLIDKANLRASIFKYFVDIKPGNRSVNENIETKNGTSFIVFSESNWDHSIRGHRFITNETLNLMSHPLSLSDPSEALLYHHGNGSTKDSGFLNSSYLHILQRVAKTYIGASVRGDDNRITWNAVLLIAGYTLMNCCYDISNCFLKTFVLDCTPSESQADILIQLVLVACVGGVVSTIIGSSDLGMALSAGTNFDPNSVMCCVLASLCFILVSAGTITTILTGLLWRAPTIKTCHDVLKNDENDNISGTNEKRPLVKDSPFIYVILLHKEDMPAKASNQPGRVHEAVTKYDTLSSTSALPVDRSLSDKKELVETNKLTHFKRFIQRHDKLILINILGFLLNSAIFVFPDYSANFLGQAVFKGDPSAPKDSPEYIAYLEGVALGSQGILIGDVTCAIAIVFHKKILSWLGWKIEAFAVFVVQCLLCCVLGVTLNVWVYYLSAVWLGPLRAVALSVPYILATKVSSVEGGDKNAGFAIASVSTTVPLGILVCSLVMGPLLDITGNTTTSMYYTAVCSLFSAFIVLLIEL